MDELVYTAEQYSGCVDKIEGDRIMVLFGAIRSTENSILVADSVYSYCSENIQWNKPAKLVVKGISVPVRVWKPVAVAYNSNPAFCPGSVRTVFVAREKENSLLAEIRKIQQDRTSGTNRMDGARHLIVELTGLLQSRLDHL